MRLHRLSLFLSFIMLVILIGIVPHTVSAHEVYVLSPQAIAHDISTPSPNPFSAAMTHKGLFLLSGLIAIILVLAVFLISISRMVEKELDPSLMRLKRWAPFIARLTIGFSLLFSAYYNALFGPELPLPTLFGSYAILVRFILCIIACCILLGLFVRTSAVLGLILFFITVGLMRVYMLTYLNYFGELILLLILGGGHWSLDKTIFNATLHGWAKQLEPYSFAINRVCFGVAALYASWYAKLIHSNLALDTVNQYHLTNYFHFPPLFIVLGALIVESLIGFFFIFGFEIRFTAFFFLSFLCLSLCFFGETVWPHLILIGLNLTMIAHGYDQYSLEGRFFKRRNREPVF